MALKNPIGSNIEFTREYTVSVDGSGTYGEIVIPSGSTDCAYGGIQIDLTAIRTSGSLIEDPQSYFLYGGKLPYNVHVVDSLPRPSGASGFSPQINTPLVPSGQSSIPTMSGHIFTIDTIGGDTAGYTVQPSVDFTFGITRFRFYDFEGERIESIDFISNPLIRDVSGIPISDLTMPVGSGSVAISFYAGLFQDQNSLGRIQPVIWDVVDGFDTSVVGVKVSLNTTFGPLISIIPLTSGEGSYTIKVSRDKAVAPEQTTPYLLRGDIISEGVTDDLDQTIPLTIV